MQFNFCFCAKLSYSACLTEKIQEDILLRCTFLYHRIANISQIPKTLVRQSHFSLNQSSLDQSGDNWPKFRIRAVFLVAHYQFIIPTHRFVIVNLPTCGTLINQHCYSFPHSYKQFFRLRRHKNTKSIRIELKQSDLILS